MSSFNDRRPFPNTIPAVVLVVSLLLGCLVGRFLKEHDPPWLSVAGPVISILAMIQPTPLTLGAAGIVAGIALEALRMSYFDEGHLFEGGDLTLKGKVVKRSPSLYGQSALTIRVKEVLCLERIPVNLLFMASVPDNEEVVQGSKIVLRATLRKSDHGMAYPWIMGRAVTGGWLSATEGLSSVIKGRERLLRALDGSRASPASGLLGAISLGERWRVGVGARDILRRSGTYHLLAISGVHVGAVIFPFLLLLRFCASATQRTRPRAVRAIFLILSLCAVGTYMCFTGLSASALRATVYFILAGSAGLVVRSSSSLASLSWCVLTIVCFSAGQQPDVSLSLSALAVTGIIMSGGRFRGREQGGLLEGMMRMAIGAVLFTLPVAVWVAGGISAIAPLANIVAGITFGLFLIPSAVLMDWAALVPSVPLEPLIGIWLKGAGIGLGSLRYLAYLPFSFLSLSPAGCLAASLAAVLGIPVWRCYKYRLSVGVAIFCFILAASGSGQIIGERNYRDDLVISFPAVGQADAAIIRHNGKTVLVDCGPGGLPGRNGPAAKALQRLGVRNIDALFLSHLHPDHAGGLEDIMAMWPIEVIYLADPGVGGHGMEDLEDASGAGAKVQLLHYGEEVFIASLRFKVLGPEDVKRPMKDINRGSLQLLLEAGDFQALFTGDTGWDQVLRSLGRVNSLDVIKMPHHGSKKGFPPAGMDDAVLLPGRFGEVIAVCPSRPPGNRRLPSPEVIRWFEARGVRFVYTGDNGVKIRYTKRGSLDNGATVVDKDDWF
jgi:competence protein ComEC